MPSGAFHSGDGFRGAVLRARRVFLVGAVALGPRVRRFPTIRPRPSRRGMRAARGVPVAGGGRETISRAAPPPPASAAAAPNHRARVASRLPSSSRDATGPRSWPVFSSSWMLCACQASTAEAPAATTPTPTRVQPLTRIARRRPRPASSAGEVAVCVLTTTGGGATGSGIGDRQLDGAGRRCRRWRRCRQAPREALPRAPSRFRWSAQVCISVRRWRARSRFGSAGVVVSMKR